MQHPDEEARALRDEGEYDKALQVCDSVLSVNPKNPAFTALRRDILIRRQKVVLELIRQVGIQLDSEPSFEKRFELIEQALKRFPDEQFFRQSYSEVNQVLEEVRALATKADQAIDEGQFEAALSILETISGIYPEYPRLDAERKRITILQEMAKLRRRKAHRVVGIRMALAQKDIEAASRKLQMAFEEFPKDDELVRLQNELTQLENKTKEGNDIYEDGCRQIAAEEYEAGIAMLRQANRLDSKSRRIETALFNALVQFAKNIVDFEPKRARHLLEEAARLSPYNLTLENASKYLSDRIRECALNECRMRVQVLRDEGRVNEALKLVNALADQYHLHDDPVLEEIMSEIWINFEGQSGSKQEVGNKNEQSEPKPEARMEVHIEPVPTQTVLSTDTRTDTRTDTSKDADATNSDVVEHQELSVSRMQWTHSARTAMETWKIRERSRRARRRIAAERQTLRTKILKWCNRAVQKTQSAWTAMGTWKLREGSRRNLQRIGADGQTLREKILNWSHPAVEWTQSAWTAMGTWEIHERSQQTPQRAAEGPTLRAKTMKWLDLSQQAIVRSLKRYKIMTGVICLLLIVVTTLLSTGLRRQPELTSIGKATMLNSVALLREPSPSSRMSGKVKTGQTVELLTRLPAMTPEAWLLVRPTGDKQTYGYTRLQNLDRIKTGDSQFDLWHAMSFLDRSAIPEELATRLANIDQMLQAQPLAPSRDTDAILLRLSKAFAILAAASQDDPRSSRSALLKAEVYLSRVEGALQLSDEANEVKESINRTHIALGDVLSESAGKPPATQPGDEQARIMRLANNASARSTH